MNPKLVLITVYGDKSLSLQFVNQEFSQFTILKSTGHELMWFYENNEVGWNIKKITIIIYI